MKANIKQLSHPLKTVKVKKSMVLSYLAHASFKNFELRTKISCYHKASFNMPSSLSSIKQLYTSEADG